MVTRPVPPRAHRSRQVRREVEELNQEKYRRTSERQDSTSSDRDVKEEHPQQSHDATVKEEADVKKEDGDGEQVRPLGSWWDEREQGGGFGTVVTGNMPCELWVTRVSVSFDLIMAC